jgi:hypothetical protein
MEQWYKLHIQKIYTVVTPSCIEFLGALFNVRIVVLLVFTDAGISFFRNIGNPIPKSTVS